LNRAYEKARSNLDIQNQNKLRNIQLAWIKFRDQFCEIAGSFYEGGSFQYQAITQCKSDISDQQRKNLEGIRP
jgi:uncharacterized protein YecT (DUF1311 family)